MAPLGGSSVLHCTSLLRTIFMSLAYAHEHFHAYNARNFLQAKLNGKIIACFILNEHSDLYFLLYNFGVQFMLFKLKH